MFLAHARSGPQCTIPKKLEKRPQSASVFGGLFMMVFFLGVWWAARGMLTLGGKKKSI